ncbi:MAG: sigma-70 family RNA polymerase sigma factor [Clostridiales bacterium]|nr:sigma-70 family RNA polymerase sigma factor [Clostridiales bacterium]
MEDGTIVQMLWDRCEQALEALAAKYGRFCHKIALNILGINEDAEECVNDTYLSTWNSIPPKRPSVLAPYVGRITRNLALNLYKQKNAEKRGGGNLPLVLDELSEVIPSDSSTSAMLEEKEMMQQISDFLAGLSPDKRKIFVRRYWYTDSVKDIAQQYGLTENNVSVTLNRLKKQLREKLSEGGVEV